MPSLVGLEDEAEDERRGNHQEGRQVSVEERHPRRVQPSSEPLKASPLDSSRRDVGGTAERFRGVLAAVPSEQYRPKLAHVLAAPSFGSAGTVRDDAEVVAVFCSPEQQVRATSAVGPRNPRKQAGTRQLTRGIRHAAAAGRRDLP